MLGDIYVPGIVNLTILILLFLLQQCSDRDGGESNIRCPIGHYTPSEDIEPAPMVALSHETA